MPLSDVRSWNGSTGQRLRMDCADRIIDGSPEKSRVGIWDAQVNAIRIRVICKASRFGFQQGSKKGFEGFFVSSGVLI
jgi:hypothetical protein